MIDLEKIKLAMATNVWDLGNQVLYDMCKSNFRHDNDGAVIAKIWLIGRAYAAAIERRHSKTEYTNENFYLDVVAKQVINSNIDKWLKSLNHYTQINDDSIEKILEVHSKLTELFRNISGMDKRSLASKYLHFHFPHLFYIYDARAVNAISNYSKVTGRASRSKYQYADNEYRKFVEKCLTLNSFIQREHNLKLNPRQLDNFLLSTHANA